MTEQEQNIFNHITGFGVYDVEVINGVRRDPWQGTEVKVYRAGIDEPMDFYFPEYADMSDEEMAAVIANHLRMELWNSVTR